MPALLEIAKVQTPFVAFPQHDVHSIHVCIAESGVSFDLDDVVL